MNSSDQFCVASDLCSRMKASIMSNHFDSLEDFNLPVPIILSSSCSLDQNSTYLAFKGLNYFHTSKSVRNILKDDNRSISPAFISVDGVAMGQWWRVPLVMLSFLFSLSLSLPSHCHEQQNAMLNSNSKLIFKPYQNSHTYIQEWIVLCLCVPC